MLKKTTKDYNKSSKKEDKKTELANAQTSKRTRPPTMIA